MVIYNTWPVQQCPQQNHTSHVDMDKQFHWSVGSVTADGCYAGSNAPAQDFAMFLTRAQAFRSSINRTLSMLYSFQPQAPPAITVQTSLPGRPMQYPPALTSFAAAPSQTAAVLTSVQAKQQLAWHPALLPQVRQPYDALLQLCV